jgi:hypothetical protein
MANTNKNHFSIEKLGQTLAISVIMVVLAASLMQAPNPVTHVCIPNLRTEMGISSEGYPVNRHFCEDGYYPVLKFGQDQAIDNRIKTISVLLPILLLSPVAMILINRKKLLK